VSRRDHIPEGIPLLGEGYDKALAGYTGRAAIYSASALRRLVAGTGTDTPVQDYLAVRAELLSLGGLVLARTSENSAKVQADKEDLQEAHGILRGALVGVVEDYLGRIRYCYSRKLCMAMLESAYDWAGEDVDLEAELARMEGELALLPRPPVIAVAVPAKADVPA
jgi:hypothetical protein